MEKIIILLSLLSAAVFAQQKGSFTDFRDGKRYSTVKIGEQTWMAENLNHSGKGKKIGACYNGKPELCKKYGALYDLEEAMEACPSGWSLPSREDWEVLIDFIGGNESAGTKFKSKTGWSSWDNYGETVSGNGTDAYGFAALPGGSGDWGGNFDNLGNHGYWWSSSKNRANKPIGLYMNSDTENAYVDYDYKKMDLHSVRCVRD
jgi:uncharacterized protein (TIGR02145 family)